MMAYRVPNDERRRRYAVLRAAGYSVGIAQRLRDIRATTWRRLGLP